MVVVLDLDFFSWGKTAFEDPWGDVHFYRYKLKLDLVLAPGLLRTYGHQGKNLGECGRGGGGGIRYNKMKK